ncbi:MAG: glycosyl transferase family 28 [Propioniciclava sp.]|uniref:glycosyltransferase family protein n=1 Tax=Propioniciclava sp. TaxID=2038686 RepID=UPI0039E47ECC
MTTVVLYSHDSVGLGHARRNRALAFTLASALPALIGEPVRGLLIAGHPDASRDSLPPGWDWLVLPGVTHGTTSTGARGYVARALDAGPARMRALRGSVVRAAVDALDPDLFVVDRHPYGADRELAGVLDRLRDNGCRTVLGLRDVLDAPGAAAAEWARLGDARRLADAFDAVWLYGDTGVHDARTTGELPGVLADKAIPTGYLARGRPPATGGAPRGPYVLTLLGGGSDGRDLAELAVAAEVPEGHEHLVVTGPQLPPEHAAHLNALSARQATGGRGTTIVRTAPNVPELIARASAVVSMCGYNTATEIMASSTPALVLPRTQRRLEQELRARGLASVGALDHRPLAAVTPDDLSGWLAGAVGRRTTRHHLDLDGLRRVPQLAAALLDRTPVAHTRKRCHAQ